MKSNNVIIGSLVAFNVFVFVIAPITGCSSGDPEKDKLRNDCAQFQREITKLNGLLSAEKTPQVEMVERMEKLNIQHRQNLEKLNNQHKQELDKLQGKIVQMTKEMKEKEIYVPLAGLAAELKEIRAENQAQAANIQKLFQLCDNLEKTKSERGHYKGD